MMPPLFSQDSFSSSTSPLDFLLPPPSLDQLTQAFAPLPDPSQPSRPRPSTEILLERKRYILDYWQARNERMVEDEKMLKLIDPLESKVGDNEIGASESLVLNDPYVIVEKVANMISGNEPIINIVPKDAGMKHIAQIVEDFLWWWRDEANIRWMGNLNNNLNRDEVYYLASRGWLAGRIMLDPADEEFPFRYDLIDPIQVYPQPGAKEVRWVFHVYKDSKTHVMNDFGWDDDLLQRIEEITNNLGEHNTVEVSSYFDDTWHVVMIDDKEIWSAPHNYGFVPFVIAIAFGPPFRRTDPSYASSAEKRDTNITWSTKSVHAELTENFTKWWGVSIFQGIKDVYRKMNKLASAILTEAMKAPNPPIVIWTNAQGEAEAKSIDTGIGATNYLLSNQENYQVVNYGFKPGELAPLMQLLSDARNRGSLPSVMYGEGANFLSGFAVNLLTSGARDIAFPLLKSHEWYLQRLFRSVLRLFAEHYTLPISLIGRDLDSPSTTNARSKYTTIRPEQVKEIGYSSQVFYKNFGPMDKQVNASVAAMLVDKKIISLDTARGEEFLGLRSPILENKKVMGDLAYFNPKVVEVGIPQALIEVDPVLYFQFMEAKMKEMQEKVQQMQMMLATGKLPPPPSSASPPASSSPASPPPPQEEEEEENPISTPIQGMPTSPPPLPQGAREMMQSNI